MGRGPCVSDAGSEPILAEHHCPPFGSTKIARAADQAIMDSPPEEHGRPASPRMARSQVKEINGRAHKLKCYHVPMPDFKSEHSPGKEK